MINIHIPKEHKYSEEELKNAMLKKVIAAKVTAIQNPTVENIWLFNDLLRVENEMEAEHIVNSMKADLLTHITAMESLKGILKSVISEITKYSPHSSVKRKSLEHELSGVDADDFDTIADFEEAKKGEILPNVHNLMLVWANVIYNLRDEVKMSKNTILAVTNSSVPNLKHLK
jgi:hypothetical protein